MADQPGRPGRTAAQQAGDAAESAVADRLAEAGWIVLARNVHVGRHELDLVAVDRGPPQALVVIEVRWRHGAEPGSSPAGIQGAEASQALAVVAAVVEVLRIRGRDGVLRAEKQNCAVRRAFPGSEPGVVA